MGDAVEKAGIQELAEKDVAAALSATGREVEANTEHFKKYASELQRATVYGDEQILNAQSLLIQLTKLDRIGLDGAMKGAIGLASVYKTDLFAATTLVGKALAGNYGALSRYGIVVERTASDEEKRVQLLEQLAVMYKRAEAETETYQGAVKQLANTYGDLKEEIGKAVIENEDVLKAINSLKEGIRKFIDEGGLQELSLYFSVFIETVKGGFSTWEKVDKFLFGWADKLHEGKEKTDSLAEAQRKLNEALAKAGIESIIERFKEEREALSSTTELIETQIKSIKGIVVGMDFWGIKLVQIDELYKNLQDTLISIDQLLPEPRDLTGVLEQAVPEFEKGTAYIGDLFKGMSEEQIKGMEATWATAKQIGYTLALGSQEIAYAMAVINTAEAVTKALAAAAPPFNLILAGISAAAGAIQIATIAGQSIPSAQAGGITAREGLYHLHPGELITPANKVTNIYNRTAGGVTIIVDIKEQLDPYSAQKIVRQQIIPQILESLDINENKRKWQEKLE